MTFRFDSLADEHKSSIEGYDSSGHYFCPYRPGMSPQEVEAVTKRIREEVKSSRLQQQIESAVIDIAGTKNDT